METPPTIHDFVASRRRYDTHYPAPGSPALAFSVWLTVSADR